MQNGKVFLFVMGLSTLFLMADTINKEEIIFTEAQKEMNVSDMEVEFVMPPAGALANSLTKDLGALDWSAFIKTDFDPKQSLGSNMDKALLLGIKGADAYFLAIAHKSSELKNVSMSLNFLLNKIKIENKSLNNNKRKNELKLLAEKISAQQWSEVLIGISQLKEEINSDFEVSNESSLKLLNSIGGWLEGYRLAVEGFKTAYKAEATATLLQNDLILYLLDAIKNDAETKSFSKTEGSIQLLTDISTILMKAKAEQLTKEEVEALAHLFATTTVL